MLINYVILFVRDMTVATAFYRDVLDLPLRFESPHWTEFETEGTTLALHLTEEASPAERKPTAAGTVRFGFQAPDLDAFHKRMLERGVTCLQEPQMQFGAKIAQYADPDGVVFGMGEAR